MAGTRQNNLVNPLRRTERVKMIHFALNARWRDLGVAEVGGLLDRFRLRGR